MFDELDASGAMTGRGVKITDATLRGHPVTLQVDRHFLSAVEATAAGPVTYEGSALEGTSFILTAPTLAGEVSQYNLTIERFIDTSNSPTLHFWAGNTSESVPFYRIQSQKIGSGNDKSYICRQAFEPTDPWKPAEHSAILFRGDHYDAVNKLVTDIDKPTLFNLACAGAAPAKMHLLRHTNAAAVISPGDRVYQTTVSERTAMLKMLTADYCGTGRSYTVDGQPLKYGDERHWFVPTPTISSARLPASVCSIEALWTENGAACLDTPRRVAPGDIHCPGDHPGDPSRVIPPCGGAAGVLGWETGAWDARAGAHVHVISAN